MERMVLLFAWAFYVNVSGNISLDVCVCMCMCVHESQWVCLCEWLMVLWFFSLEITKDSLSDSSFDNCSEHDIETLMTGPNIKGNSKIIIKYADVLPPNIFDKSMSVQTSNRHC